MLVSIPPGSLISLQTDLPCRRMGVVLARHDHCVWLRSVLFSVPLCAPCQLGHGLGWAMADGSLLAEVCVECGCAGCQRGACGPAVASHCLAAPGGRIFMARVLSHTWEAGSWLPWCVHAVSENNQCSSQVRQVWKLD